MTIYFKTTINEIILTEEDNKNYRDNNICRFREKETIVDKVRCYCHLTGKYRRPALSNCNNNVTQKQ